MAIFFFVAGLMLLVVGAEALVRGASRLAAAIGVTPLVIGLTIVAFGTSAPEMAVSVKAALTGQADISVGNVVGSNIFNVLFILGVSALITPLLVSQQLVRFDVPLMIILSVVTLLFSLNGTISRTEGIIMLAGLGGYVWFLIILSRKESGAVKEEYTREFGAKNNWLLDIVTITIGLVMLVVGSRWLVNGAVAFAHYLGVSELVIGLTIVAAGTSLPEVFTSAIAALRGERDIAVGNVVGSNIFNILGVLGAASVVAPTGLAVSPALVSFDIPVMIAVAFACLPIFFTEGLISRQEGALLLGYYLIYMLYIVLAAAQHEALSRFSAVMLYFVIPLTLITLVIIALLELRRNNAIRK